MAPAGAGIPVKKFPAQAGLFGSSIITLNRARRSPAHIAKTSAAIQPADLSSCSTQKYRMSAGATPKLTKSARLSSSAPNRRSEERRVGKECKSRVSADEGKKKEE